MRLQGIDDLRDLAIGVQRMFVEVRSERDPDRHERLPDVGEDLFFGDRLEEPFRRLCTLAVAVLLQHATRDVLDVLALVVIPGEFDRVAEQLQIAQPHGIAEDAHLPAGVVEIVLALDLVAGPLQQPRDRIAEHRTAAVPDGQRTGRIGAHELHLDPASLCPRRSGRNASSRLQQHAQLPAVEGLGEADVDEPGSRDLDPGDEVRIARQERDDLLGKCAGFLPRRLREDHRTVGRQIAVAILPRAFDGDGSGQVIAGLLAVLQQVLNADMTS